MPSDWGQKVTGFQDFFSGPALDPRWVSRGRAGQPNSIGQNVFILANGVLRITGAQNDPTHLLFEQSGYNPTNQEVLVKMRVVQAAIGDAFRGGPSVSVGYQTNNANRRDFLGLNWHFRTGFGTTPDYSFHFLYDQITWGNPTHYVWTRNTWYWLRLRHQPSATSADLSGKFWPADGSTPEPENWSNWNYYPNNKLSLGHAGLAAPLANGGVLEVAYFGLKASGLPEITLGVAETPLPDAVPQPVARSGLVNSGLKTIQASISGATNLWLVITDGGDGTGCDWMDWAAPELIRPDGSAVSLTEFSWTDAWAQWLPPQLNKNIGGQPLRVGNVNIPKGIGSHAASVIHYRIPSGEFSFFRARVGPDDVGTSPSQGCGSTAEFMVFTRAPALDYGFSSFAGGRRLSGTANGQGSAARFNSPHGLAVDGQGNLFVADYSHTIRKITPAGLVSTFAGSANSPGTANGSGAQARFRLPIALATDLAGNVYVADFGNHAIRKITPQAVVTTFAGRLGIAGTVDGPRATALLNQPSGIAIGPDGTAYIAEYGNHTIRKVAPDGRVTTMAGLALNPGGNDGDGNGARFNGPHGLALNSQGVLYVADLQNHTIRQISPEGIVSTLAGVPGETGAVDGWGASTRFYRPWGVTLDPAGNLLVTDRDNHAIRQITPAGYVTTLAGVPAAIGYADAPGILASFQFPRGIALASNGDLYIVDTGNVLIRKGSPSRIRSSALSVGGFSAVVPVSAQFPYTVESSPDLASWSTFTNIMTTSPRLEFTESPAASAPARFFRVKLGNP